MPQRAGTRSGRWSLRSLWLLSPLVVFACGPEATVTLSFQHDVDGAPLVFDDVRYANAAGNAYSVTRLEYYVSDFTFERQGAAAVRAGAPVYVDAKGPAEAALLLPPGEYSALTVLLGLTPDVNRAGGLPNTLEHLEMAWPEGMGGGYHFLKFEGRWRDTATTTAGFALHLGTTEERIALRLPGPITVREGAQLVLHMNLNQWLRAPKAWDFAADGTFTMGVAPAMRALHDNGGDVLTLEVQ